VRRKVRKTRRGVRTRRRGVRTRRWGVRKTRTNSPAPQKNLIRRPKNAPTTRANILIVNTRTSAH
jgi:hypothetical protein